MRTSRRFNLLMEQCAPSHMEISAGLAEATADGDLLFTFGSGSKLQLHSTVASMWSRSVLRHAIASGCKRDSEDRLLLPMPDAEYEAWYHALPFMYPPLGDAPPSVTWDTAKHLLLLAHKYDMPGLGCHVMSFLKANPLDENRAWEWLQLACKLEMSDTVKSLCIDAITDCKGHWPKTMEHGITMEYAGNLYNTITDKYKATISSHQADMDNIKADMKWLADTLSECIDGQRLRNWQLSGFRERLQKVREKMGWKKP